LSKLQTSAPIYPSPVVALRGRAQTSPRATSRRLVRLQHRVIVSEQLFRHALVRERKRADRFEESFALVLVALDGGVSQTPRWNAVVDALADRRHDTDVIGWYEQGAVIGLIRSLADQDPGEAAASLAASVRRQLVIGLNQSGSEGCSLRLEVYSPRREAIPAVLREPEDLSQKSRKHLRRCAKRLLDIAGSIALVAVLSPLFLLIAALVKATSRGPVFFRQQRIGTGGRPFMMLKFRTMRLGADESIHKQYVTQFIQSGAGAAAADGGVFKIVNDPRVTALGRLLRRSSLDELPQFFNVLKGEMSLVGPRPPLAYEVENYKRWHRRRLFEAKPGITGLWQVTGRSQTTFEDMVRLDLRYARSHSVWTDIKILAATPRAVVIGKGAH
jgi:lipopolysaccharide/colanic/teichoic acid biosynthesis glycosyltransferase